jgi:hypothetical protein
MGCRYPKGIPIEDGRMDCRAVLDTRGKVRQRPPMA